MKRLWLIWLATLTGVVVACGGKVNLGEHGPSDPALHPEGEAPGEPLPTVGQLAAQLTSDNQFDMLAVAGDYLYLGTFSGVSRCEKANCIPTLQPSCLDGPMTVGRYNGNLNALTADGELFFYSDQSLIYRYKAGVGSAVPLLADELLSEAPIDPAREAAPPSIVSIATAGGVLYASTASSAEFYVCVEECPHEIVRWPVNGGARQTVVASPTQIGSVFAFAEEVAWTEASSVDGFDYGAVLYSCLASDCDATRRALGRVVNLEATVVADDTDLYWFEAHRDRRHPTGVTGLVNHQIRRAARLSPPLER